MQWHSSQNSLNVHFGLGLAEKIDTLQVAWPNRGYQEFFNRPRNQFSEIVEINFPKAPTSLAAVNLRLGEAKLSWIDNSSDEIGFRIERSKGNASNFKQVSTVLGNINSFVDKGLQEGSTYHYRIASITSGGFSVYSNVISLFIRKKQLVTFNPIGIKALDSPPFELSATSSAGLPTSFKIIAGSDKVNLNGNRITILSLGISKLGAFQTGSGTFHPSDTIAQTLDVNLITGIADREDSITVYPNPVNDYLVIQGLSPINSNAIKIISTKGQSVYGNDFKGSVEIISLKDFTPGIYILFINTNRYKVVKR